jgi:hypothetical protein
MASDKPFINEALSKKVEPLMVKSELQIKLLIRNYLINNWDKSELTNQIDKVIQMTVNQLPKEIPNKDEIYLGFKKSVQMWYAQTKYQIQPIIIRLGTYSKERVTGKWIERSINIIETKEKLQAIKALPEVIPGASAVLYTELNRLNYLLKELATYGLQTDYVSGQTPMSLFAKLEMVNRYKNNMEQLSEKLDSGEEVVRFSQHRDPSERCAPWQGKAVHLLLPAVNAKFETGLRLPTGEAIYSYRAITTQVDAYGWKNNIHVGFNCRHSLKNIEDRKPDPYTVEEIKRGRKANAYLRNLERQIRNLKKKYALIIGDNPRREMRYKIDEATANYYKFAKENKVVAYGWRLEV